jgi:hypothetical protein
MPHHHFPAPPVRAAPGNPRHSSAWHTQGGRGPGFTLTIHKYGKKIPIIFRHSLRFHRRSPSGPRPAEPAPSVAPPRRDDGLAVDGAAEPR